MPFPINLEEMLASGHVFLRGEPCSECGETVEVFRTPGGRELAMQPMCELLRLAERHYCNIAQTPQTAPQGVGVPQPSPEPEQAQGGHAVPQQPKMYGVTDKNMIACGWQDGTLAIQFRHGLYHYSNVPENVFATLRKVPYPNNYFTKVVKSHPELYPYTKLS